MFGLGTQELIIILVIIMIIFGAGKLPQIGEGLGKAIKNFKKATNDAENTLVISPCTVLASFCICHPEKSVPSYSTVHFLLNIHKPNSINKQLKYNILSIQ